VEHARTDAEQLFAALGARVTEPWRDPKYDAARIKLAHAAFLPSRVWSDTSVWISSTESRRSLLVNGRLLASRYRLEAAHAPALITQLADSRHVVNLTRLSPDEYAWDTDVAYGIGSVSAAQMAAFVSALVGTADGRREQEIRADVRATIPLASVALGKLFSVDSIRATRLDDRSTVATFAVSITPAGVEPQYPEFAAYMRRYVGTARMHWTVSDRAGGVFLDASLASGRMLARLRTVDGRLVPLTGAPRPMPDSLTLNGDVAMRVRRFTIGFRDYHAEFDLVATPHERAWNIVSRQEPQWVLPLVGERLLRTPLRRPFQGSGALFRLGVRDDSAGGQTVLHRRLHLEVQESLILRFIGKLGSIAVSDFSGKVEQQQSAWLREVFTALVADAGALRSGL